LNGHFEDGEERRIANSVVATAKGSEVSPELPGDFRRKVDLAQRIQQKHLEALESNAGAPDNGSLEGVPDSNTPACQNAVPPKPPTLQGNPNQPVRLYLGTFYQNKGIWQYQIGSGKITVNVFFSRTSVDDYNRLVLNSGAVEVGRKHEFGNHIFGNGPEGGVSRSISHSIRTGELGEDLDSIADAAVDAMSILWRKFCDKL
jgi:hypothetical protein